LVHGQFADCWHFRTLNITDNPESSPEQAVAEECLAAAADTSLAGTRIVREPEAVIARDRVP
jgi:hypothetical protein